MVQGDDIYLDFQNDLDKVPYYLQISKVPALKITGEISYWTENCLKDRRQGVLIDCTASRWAPFTSGALQQSVFGTLLFLSTSIIWMME